MMSLASYFSIVCSNSTLSYKRTQITNWDTCIIIWNLITITNSRIISILIKSLPSRPKQFFKTNICAGLVILMFYMRIIFIISHLSHWLTNRITYSVFLYKRGGGRQMRHFSYVLKYFIEIDKLGKHNTRLIFTYVPLSNIEVL